MGRVLARRGHRVYFGTRDPALLGQPVESDPAAGHWLPVDVSDSESIRRAAEWLAGRESSLDILINNAGIYPDREISILEIPREQLGRILQTNTLGPVEVTQAFLPLLRRSAAARIIHISSAYGQMAGLSTMAPGYSLSKLALNGVTRLMAETLRDEGIAVNAISPGWVRTEMGGPQADRSVEEGASGIVWLALEAPQSWTGRFLRDGKDLDW